MIILPMTGTPLFAIEPTEIKRQNKNRNKYVGENCNLVHIPPGKLLLTKGEAVMNGEHSVALI